MRFLRTPKVAAVATLLVLACGDMTDRVRDAAADVTSDLYGPDASDAASCEAARTLCDFGRFGSVCVDLSAPGYCGSCQRYALCELEPCELTGCCPIDCSLGPGCVDVDIDEFNCGGCGIVCPDGTYCVEGECMGPPDAGSRE